MPPLLRHGLQKPLQSRDDLFRLAFGQPQPCPVAISKLSRSPGQ